MKTILLIFAVLAMLMSANAADRLKNDKALKAKANQLAAEKSYKSIVTNVNYATYTNIVALLGAANNWNDAKPLLIKYISIQQGLDNVDAIYTGKKDKLKGDTKAVK